MILRVFCFGLYTRLEQRMNVSRYSSAFILTRDINYDEIIPTTIVDHFKQKPNRQNYSFE